MKQKLIDQIIQEILGYSQFGYVDLEKWNEFGEKYFFRDGEVSGEKYSSEVNRHLLGAAVLQVLAELKTKLEALKTD